ncbi:PIN domain nuclease, a component of toxin-antitoxin system (PIN domain) [Micrococcales bacterium KH10]|nr:PIN domain nuclease, a component of toxin-antitoxin system (PIN domain) [Micrococcales bacterium KH10]
MIVLDASAVLAFLQDEQGADRVEKLLPSAVIGAANWSEVAQKVRARGGNWHVASALLQSYGLSIEAVTVSDAEQAAELWHRGSGLSLGDRLCLALGNRLHVKVLTADRAWSESDFVEQLR